MEKIKSKQELHELLDNNSNSDELLIVKFSAPWCGPCRMLAGVIERIEKEQENVKFVDIDVDELEEIATEYAIMSIPVLLFFKGGFQVDKVVGGIPEKTLREKIEENINK